MRLFVLVLVIFGSLALAPTALALAQPAPAPAPTADPAKAAELRQICTQAMNADRTFADSVIQIANNDTWQQHHDAADHIAKNERHVILAYAAMWLVAAAFVIFLWRRQLALKDEIARLQRDLAAAIKDGAK